jgi:pimeloyl-ACP methyl ester carboxylesterase
MEVKQSISEVKFVPVLDGQLAYEVAGNGPVVLCLPSLGDTRREYERLAPELAESGYRVITTDLRGMGQSRGNFKSHSLRDLVNDIQAILDAEQVKEAFLLGCSVSGASAGLFAIEHPERVAGLVLFSPILRTGSPLMGFVLGSLLRTPGLGRVFWSNYFKSLYPARPLEQDYLDHIQVALKQPGAMKSVVDMCLTPRIDNQIAQIRVPTLVYLGTRDPDFKDVRQEAERLKGKLPQAQVVVLEGAGHYPQREFSDRVVPEVVQWLNGARSEAASQR